MTRPTNPATIAGGEILGDEVHPLDPRQLLEIGQHLSVPGVERDGARGLGVPAFREVLPDGRLVGDDIGAPAATQGRSMNCGIILFTAMTTSSSVSRVKLLTQYS